MKHPVNHTPGYIVAWLDERGIALSELLRMPRESLMPVKIALFLDRFDRGQYKHLTREE